MNNFFAAFYPSLLADSDVDPMLDLIAQEDEAQAVSDLHNGYLCTVE